MCIGSIALLAEAWDDAGARLGRLDDGCVVPLSFVPDAQPGVYLLVDLRADPFDQPLGQGAFVLMTQFAVRGRRRGDVLICPPIHVSTICHGR